jgi:hypothetical protein
MEHHRGLKDGQAKGLKDGQARGLKEFHRRRRGIKRTFVSDLI